MDTILQTLLSWQFILFCLAIASFTFAFRKVVEYSLANWKFIKKESKIWTELVLPISPMFFGSLAGFVAREYPYPVEVGTSTSGRIIFGLVAGLLSGLVYRVMKAFLINNIPKNIQDVTSGALASKIKEAIVPPAITIMSDGYSITDVPTNAVVVTAVATSDTFSNDEPITITDIVPATVTTITTVGSTTSPIKDKK